MNVFFDFGSIFAESVGYLGNFIGSLLSTIENWMEKSFNRTMTHEHWDVSVNRFNEGCCACYNIENCLDNYRY